MEKYVEQRKYHYLYKIENLVNGKYYYGIHSTDNLEDGYMGSGTYLKKAYDKYGIENFKKTILEFLPDRTSLLKREREIVNDYEIKNAACYNVTLGGGSQYTFLTFEEQQIKNRKSWETRKLNENWKKEQFCGYNNPEFLGLCKQKYEYNKEELIKWFTLTNVPDGVIERLFNKKCHEGKVRDYYISQGWLPAPIKTEKIRYENGYKLKTFFNKNVKNVLFINGSDTKKHYNKLEEVIKFINDNTCSDSKLVNYNAYDCVNDLHFFEKIGIIEKTGKTLIIKNTGKKGKAATGRKTLWTVNIKHINCSLVDEELNEYGYDVNGKLIQKGRFQL